MIAYLHVEFTVPNILHENSLDELWGASMVAGEALAMYRGVNPKGYLETIEKLADANPSNYSRNKLLSLLKNYLTFNRNDIDLDVYKFILSRGDIHYQAAADWLVSYQGKNAEELYKAYWLAYVKRDPYPFHPEVIKEQLAISLDAYNAKNPSHRIDKERLMKSLE